MNDVSSKRVILAVDDNAGNLRLIDETLRDKYKVHTAPSGEWAMSFLQKKIPDLILLDIRMPGMNGYEFINKLKSNPELEEIPVIFLTASEFSHDEAMAFQAGAADYIKKPIVPDVVTARVDLQLELGLYRQNLEHLVVERTKRLQKTEDCILSLLANVSGYRDQETGAHVRRTTGYVEVLVNVLQEAHLPDADYYISNDYGVDIIKSAKLHDIGKVAIPDGILLKPGKLDFDEFEEMKLHTVKGAAMIDDAILELEDDSFLRVAREIVIGHHEKWNGKGYPAGIKEKEIPMSARLMAIADVYDALISKRPYKEPFSHEKAVEILFNDSGTHFDPVVLEVARDYISKFDEIAKVYAD
ncbi:MAG: response regulator [Oscillospiraceae bacterium]|nr:response regulator [Oscillospiraceae bacterium]